MYCHTLWMFVGWEKTSFSTFSRQYDQTYASCRWTLLTNGETTRQLLSFWDFKKTGQKYKKEKLHTQKYITQDSKENTCHISLCVNYSLAKVVHRVQEINGGLYMFSKLWMFWSLVYMTNVWMRKGTKKVSWEIFLKKKTAYRNF